MRFVVFHACLLVSASLQAGEKNLSLPQVINITQVEEENVKTVKSVGQEYIALLNRIGASQNLSHEKDVLSLCSPDCKKIVNGALWFERREKFLPQLLSTGEKVGFWSIESLDVIPGKDERTVVVRFLVHTEKAGVWNTLVILRCNDELLVTEINEVFNSYEGPLK
ncbi:MAG: hypothetical protein HYX48_06695 [Chlamydiales bacterium]|nr:hypothetical protein [Chlamydiales bacterium]